MKARFTEDKNWDEGEVHRGLKTRMKARFTEA
jgi:hypothetical protein